MAKKKLIFATHNPHKAKEVGQILELANHEILTLKDINFNKEIAESGRTLEENALLKVYAIQALGYQNIFSEDTGLEVLALDMAPGVHTARYAGPDCDAEENMTKLLDALKDEDDRRARFKTVVAFVHEDREYIFDGEVWGTIARERRGEGGFGYDPIFIPDGYTKTFAQLPDTVKNIISHRYNAMAEMRQFCVKYNI